MNWAWIHNILSTILSIITLWCEINSILRENVYLSISRFSASPFSEHQNQIFRILPRWSLFDQSLLLLLQNNIYQFSWKMDQTHLIDFNRWTVVQLCARDQFTETESMYSWFGNHSTWNIQTFSDINASIFRWISLWRSK